MARKGCESSGGAWPVWRLHMCVNLGPWVTGVRDLVIHFGCLQGSTSLWGRWGDTVLAIGPFLFPPNACGARDHTGPKRPCIDGDSEPMNISCSRGHSSEGRTCLPGISMRANTLNSDGDKLGEWLTAVAHHSASCILPGSFFPDIAAPGNVAWLPPQHERPLPGCGGAQSPRCPAW